MIRCKVTFGTWLFLQLGYQLGPAAAFIPKSHVFFTIRGGSDFTPEGDADSPTFETTVIQGMTDTTQNATETSMANLEPSSVQEAVGHSVQVPVVAKKGGSNPAFTNALERTGPALIMLGILYLILKFMGEKGLLYGLIPLMQLGMYSETTGVIESFHQKNNIDMEVKLEKWWWFATIFVSTTVRGIGKIGGINRNHLDLLSYSMVVIGLVMAVVGMANHDAAGPDMFRKYLGELAAFHFALVRTRSFRLFDLLCAPDYL